MASLQMHLLMLVLLLPLVTGFVSIRHTCVEDKLLNRFNYWRTVLGGISSVDSNERAACVAEKIADKLEHQQHCMPISPKGPEAKFSNYPKQLSECKIDPNTTRDGAVLMVECVTDVDVVSFNFTESKFVQYLNNSKYVSASFGAKDDLLVVILTSYTPDGSFVQSGGTGAQFVPNKVFVGFSGVAVAMFLGGFVGLFH